jgi:sterol desaturase/sphingolipid hydroxylase (fatty acid hydroxylase superfamily)
MIPSYPGMAGLPPEAVIRIGFFVLIFAVMALAETGVPRRRLAADKAGRWRVNLALTLFDAAVVRLLFPVLPVGFALFCAARGWGGLNRLSMPPFAAVLIGVLLLDLVLYLQHVLFHTLPLLWRLHGMHHTDLDIDVTTGLRFHPLEMIVSMLIKLAAVGTLGVPALGALSFEVLLNGTSLFSHANLRLPEGPDRWLRLLVVTPDMHRVHHSVVIRETNSNFGFCFPWWDRLLGTYRPQPAAGHEAMAIGLARFREARLLTLRMLLLFPFRRGGAAGPEKGRGERPDTEGGRTGGGAGAGSGDRKGGRLPQ